MENLKAKIFLAFHLLGHIVVLIRRAFGHRDSGLKKFHDNYAVEQPLWSPTPEERAQFSDFSQCINCGICEADCAVLHRAEAKNFKPSWIPLAFRYTPDLALYRPIAEQCSQCHACTTYCPTGVPLARMIQFIISKLSLTKQS